VSLHSSLSATKYVDSSFRSVRPLYDCFCGVFIGVASSCGGLRWALVKGGCADLRMCGCRNG